MILVLENNFRCGDRNVKSDEKKKLIYVDAIN